MTKLLNNSSLKKRSRAIQETEDFCMNKRVLSDGFNLLKISDPVEIDTQQCDEILLHDICNQTDDNTYSVVESSVETVHSAVDNQGRKKSTSKGKVCGPTMPILSLDNSVESLLSIPSGPRHKYVRKVDCMIDDIIRKSRRKWGQFGSSVGDSRMDHFTLPNSVGPHPLTDRSLSLYSNQLFPQGQLQELKFKNTSMRREAAKIMAHRSTPFGTCEAGLFL